MAHPLGDGEDVRSEIDEHGRVPVAKVVCPQVRGKPGGREGGLDHGLPELVPVERLAGPINEERLAGIERDSDSATPRPASNSRISTPAADGGLTIPPASPLAAITLPTTAISSPGRKQRDRTSAGATDAKPPGNWTRPQTATSTPYKTGNTKAHPSPRATKKESTTSAERSTGSNRPSTPGTSTCENTPTSSDRLHDLDQAIDRAEKLDRRLRLERAQALGLAHRPTPSLDHGLAPEPDRGLSL